MIYLNSPFRPAKLLLNSLVQIFFTVSLSVPCHNALSNTTESVWSSLRIFFFWASYCVYSCSFWIRLIYIDIDQLHECWHDVLICIKRPNNSRYKHETKASAQAELFTLHTWEDNSGNRLSGSRQTLQSATITANYRLSGNRFQRKYEPCQI